jgi:hypothetical protein
MAAIADLSALINRMSGGNSGTPENEWFYVSGRASGAAATATITGRWCSLWTYDKSYGTGAAPGAAAVPTNATTGALPITNPGGGRQKWLVQAACNSLTSGTVLLYDRLLHVSGFNGTLTTAQTVQGASPSPAITRNTSGVGNFAFYEIYTIIGTTGTTLTMTYTNQSDVNTRTSTINIGATNFREVSRAQFIPLASGDTALKAIDKIQLAASTTTAGNFGITMGRPLAYLPIGVAGGTGWRDFTTGLPGIPEIDTNACLSFLWLPSSTTPTELFGCLSTIEA